MLEMVKKFAGFKSPRDFCCIYLHDLCNLPKELFWEQIMCFIQ